MEKVAVYVPLEVSLPAILTQAVKLGASVTAADMSATDGARVFYLDAEVAKQLAEADSRLDFVPPVAVPPTHVTPPADPVTAPKPAPELAPSKKPESQAEPVAIPIPVRDDKLAAKSPKNKDTPVEAVDDDKPKPVKKRVSKHNKTSKKTTATKRKTRGSNGGES